MPRIFFVVATAVLAILANLQTAGRSASQEFDLPVGDNEGSEFAWLLSHHADDLSAMERTKFLEDTSPLRQASLLQPTPFVQPEVSVRQNVGQSVAMATTLASELSTLDRSALRNGRLGVRSFQTDLVRGEEAAPVVSTDLGNLLGKSRGTLSVNTQKRTPIINETRIRSSRIGALAASGSYWVPARADLDTAMSKIDSRLILDALVVPGPYSSLYGPGFQFVDFQMLPAPRFEGGSQYHGSSGFDYQSNGEQVFGRQSFWGGSDNWGVRGNYTHRTGNDYQDGEGNLVPSSYNSREFTMALGRDLSGGKSIEFSLLRLDQTDVEFPGYVFDIDVLVTDGYQVSYVDSDPEVGDRTETEVWYNRTRFEGNAQNPRKRQQFPLLDRLSYVGFTDVDSMSTGYRHARTWGSEVDLYNWTIGHDLRLIKQELNEIASGRTLGLPLPYIDRNSPIPRSFAVNPGIFIEYNESVFEDLQFRAGARVDYVQTDITAGEGELGQIGLGFFPASYEEIVGTSDKQTDRALLSAYGTLTRQHDPGLVTALSLGYAERAPGLTALYAAQPFLLLLQNGLNNVTGDPTLTKEKLLQADISFDFTGDYIRCGARAFHGWAFDYLTFENTNVVTGPPSGDVQQVSLRYVNTSLATLAGFESFIELAPQSRVNPFLNVQYVEGRDRTRNGDFATTNGRAGLASTKVFGLPRGFFSGTTGADSEPLPGISPLEATLGVSIENDATDPRWNLLASVRMVDNQDRVATSLLEAETPGFTVVDLRGTYRPERMRNLLWVAGIENLFDRAYQEHLDFRAPNGTRVLQPGISVYFGADLQY